MKEPDVMAELHKIREKMSRMNEEEFDKSLAEARKEYKKLMAG